MIAGQTIAAHETACELYRRAWLPDVGFELRTKFLALADKASRTVAILAEAMDRHRGRGRMHGVLRWRQLAALSFEFERIELAANDNEYVRNARLDAKSFEYPGLDRRAHVEPIRIADGTDGQMLLRCSWSSTRLMRLVRPAAGDTSRRGFNFP